MKTLVFGQNQRTMKYAFSAASRKAKIYAFSHGKVHISEKNGTIKNACETLI